LDALGPQATQGAALEEPLQGGAVSAKAGRLVVAEVLGGDVAVASDAELDDAAGALRQGPVVLLGSLHSPGGVHLDLGGVFGKEGEEALLEVVRGVIDGDGDLQRAPLAMDEI
jgi:hypothetical protein